MSYPEHGACGAYAVSLNSMLGIQRPQSHTVREETLLVLIEIVVQPCRRVLRRVPSIQMSIKVDYCNLSVDTVECPKRRQGNRMVSTESQQFWFPSIVNLGFRVGFGCFRVCQIREGLCHLSQCECVVEWGDWNVTTYRSMVLLADKFEFRHRLTHSQ